MKRWMTLAFLAIGMSIAGTAVAARDAEGCNPVGSWYGGYELTPPITTSWIATLNGQSAHSGTIIIEFTGLDVTLGGAFPGVVRTTLARGVWERRDGRTFSNTALGLGLDANGQAVYILKIRNTNTSSENCSVVTVTGVLEVFLPDQDPFADAPLFAFPGAPHIGYRMIVEPLD